MKCALQIINDYAKDYERLMEEERKAKEEEQKIIKENTINCAEYLVSCFELYLYKNLVHIISGSYQTTVDHVIQKRASNKYFWITVKLCAGPQYANHSSSDLITDEKEIDINLLKDILEQHCFCLAFEDSYIRIYGSGYVDTQNCIISVNPECLGEGA